MLLQVRFSNSFLTEAIMNAAEIPQSRAYRHLKCGVENVASEQTFEALSDPLSDMSHTWCSACNGRFPLAEFEWADTGEKIIDYYARHGARATGIERYLCSRRFFAIVAVVGFLAGAISGFWLFRHNALWLKIVMTPFVGVIGVIFFGSLKEFFLGKLIVRRVCGVRDTRMLK
jgi:hypothetical protein